MKIRGYDYLNECFAVVGIRDGFSVLELDMDFSRYEETSLAIFLLIKMPYGSERIAKKHVLINHIADVIPKNLTKNAV